MEQLDQACRALTSTPSSTFGMNRNIDFAPGVIAHRPTSLMLLWLKIPAARLENLAGSLLRKAEPLIITAGDGQTCNFRGSTHFWPHNLFDCYVWLPLCTVLMITVISRDVSLLFLSFSPAVGAVVLHYTRLLESSLGL